MTQDEGGNTGDTGSVGSLREVAAGRAAPENSPHLGSILGFPGGSDSKEPTCNAGDPGSIPGLGRSPERGHGNPLQCSCLENPMDRGAWRSTVHGVTKSWTQLSD